MLYPREASGVRFLTFPTRPTTHLGRRSHPASFSLVSGTGFPNSGLRSENPETGETDETSSWSASCHASRGCVARTLAKLRTVNSALLPGEPSAELIRHGYRPHGSCIDENLHQMPDDCWLLLTVLDQSEVQPER